MGNQPSTAKENRLTAEQIYQYSRQFELNIAEIEFCHQRFLKLSPVNDQRALPEGSEQVDWLLTRVFAQLFGGQRSISFPQFMEAVRSWSTHRIETKLEFFFKLLDYDGDAVIKICDLTVLIQQILDYNFKVGDRVRIRSSQKVGTLEYIGPTKFAQGIWGGLRLDSADGKNDGTVKGVRYFTCEPQYGIFVAYPNLELMEHVAMARSITDPFQGMQTDAITMAEFVETLAQDRMVRELLGKPILPTVLRGNGGRTGMPVAGVVQK